MMAKLEADREKRKAERRANHEKVTAKWEADREKRNAERKADLKKWWQGWKPFTTRQIPTR
jgi:hypothetical protein